MQKEYTRLNEVVRCLSPPLQTAVSHHIPALSYDIREIRLRRNRPLALVCSKEIYYINASSRLTESFTDSPLTVTASDIESTFQRICNYSLYSRQSEIINGFVTLNGGHRAGICGTAVVNGNITNIRDISSVNLRIARECVGCADALYGRLKEISGGVLICGEPCSGKTTILRDLARLISTVGGRTVSLIDERGELAGTVSGKFQNDIGMCDVFDGYPKSIAMLQAIRSMSPEMIVCDEIGSDNDVNAIEACVNSGAVLIATVHAVNREELMRKHNIVRILHTGAFSKLIFLKSRHHAGELSEICEVGDLLAD